MSRISELGENNLQTDGTGMECGLIKQQKDNLLPDHVVDNSLVNQQSETFYLTVGKH